MLEKILRRDSWADIIISTIFIILGVLLIVKPMETIGAISIILGVIFISMGVIKLVEYYNSKNKEDYKLVMALVSVILGVVILFATGPILSLFRIILGIWIIIAGVVDLQTILVWKQFKSPFWIITLIFSSLMILAGIVILINKNILLTTLGIIITVYAVLDIIDRVIFIKKISN